MLVIFLQLDLLGQIIQMSIDLHTDKSALSGFFQHFHMLTFPAFDHRGQQLNLRSLWQRHDLIHHLIHTLLMDLSAAFGTVWCADPCIEQTEIIIDLRHCSHRRSWITVGGFLINGNGRRQSFNTLNVRLLHLS